MSVNNSSSRIRHSRCLLYVILLLGAISTDQSTKFLARKLLEGSEEICFSHCFLKFLLIENHGGFLGIVNNLPDVFRFFLLTICVSVLLAACLMYLFRSCKRSSNYDLPLVFVSGGGISNLLDRFLQNGGVTDFMIIGIGTLETGIFNLADVYILVGSFFLGFVLFSAPKSIAEPR